MKNSKKAQKESGIFMDLTGRVRSQPELSRKLSKLSSMRERQTSAELERGERREERSRNGGGNEFI